VARRIQPRKQNTTILLLVEGETEQIYFSQLRSFERLAGITVIPKLAKRSSPIHIMKEAINAFDVDAYDFVWCVFDRDVLDATKPADFDEVYHQAKAMGIRFAESLPCFEVWFLLHFSVPSKYYANASAVENELCRHLQGYCKETWWLRRSELYGSLKQFQSTAIDNAKKIVEVNTRNPDPNATFSEVYTLIESILTKS